MLNHNNAQNPVHGDLQTYKSSELETPKSAIDWTQIWIERKDATPAKLDDYRSPYDIDYARVIHSASFRRLQGKMQILTTNDGDFHRTRMTHSLEVAQVGRGLVQFLRCTDERPEVQAMLPCRELIETICLIHDLGHPPFGHGGEVALNYCMRDSGGFEGNGQTLRILTKLETFSNYNGSNLTRRTLLGAMKYPVAFSDIQKKPIPGGVVSPISGQIMLSQKAHNPPKCYLDTERDVVSWIYSPFSSNDRDLIFSNRAKSFDCSIMDLADDISYAIHDLEDALSLSLVSEEQMIQDINPALWDDFIETLSIRYPNDYPQGFGTRYEALSDALFSGDPSIIKKTIGRLVGYMLSNAYVTTRDEYDSDMFRFYATLQSPALRLLGALKGFIMDRVIAAPQVQQIRFKGQNMIIQLFAYLDHDPKNLLPSHVYALYEQVDGFLEQRRIICDYVASMTDTSLTQAYERLFSPRTGSSFDNL